MQQCVCAQSAKRKEYGLLTLRINKTVASSVGQGKGGEGTRATKQTR
jgi:hypothetical protein